MTVEKRIAGAATLVGGATFVSRIFGYLRDAVIAWYFGAGLAADAFFVALRVSNLLRRLVGEGALTSSFIPVFTDVLSERSKADASSFVSSFFTLSFIILVILTVLGIVFSATLVELMAPGFMEQGEKGALTITLTRYMFPFMIFISLMAIGMGVLNTLRHFTAPAVSPIFFNISIILSAIFLAGHFVEPVYSLVIGVLIGGAAQFALQLPFMASRGFLPKPSFIFNDPAIKRIFKLMGPAVLGIGVFQLNIFITMRFASTLPEGSVSYLYYASRLMELPLGVFAVAISVAALPRLSEYASKGEDENFKNSLSVAVRLSNFLTFPATIGLVVLSFVSIDILFARGAFGPTDTENTAFALYFYAIGIVPVALTRILISVYYAFKDTVTPVIIAIGVLVVNIVLCLALMGPLGHGGLALANTGAALFNFVALMVMLRRKSSVVRFSEFLPQIFKVFVASILMGLVVYALLNMLSWEVYSTLVKLVVLVLLISIGSVTYFILCRVMKVEEVTVLRDIFAAKIGKKRQ